MNNVLTRKFVPELLIEDFIEECQKFVELYSCPLCEGILIEAIIDRCGHSFCKRCIDILKTETNKCPFSKIEIKDYLTNIVVNSVIEKQTCFCKNKSLKCEWQGKLSERKDHLYYDCLKEEVPCENEGCSIKVLREQLSEHMLNCEYRKVMCHHCKNTICYNELEKHYQSCPRMPVLCPNDCGLEVPNSDLTKHLELLCDNTISNCPFKLVGCDFMDLRRSLKIHLEENLESHLKLINQKIVSLQDQITSQQQEIQDLKQENISLKEEMSQIRDEMAGNHNQVLDMIKSLSNNLEAFKLYCPVPKTNYIPNFFEQHNSNTTKIFSFDVERRSITKTLGDNGWYGVTSTKIPDVVSEKLIINFKISSTQNSCIMFGISFSDMENPINKGSYQQMDPENLSFMFYCYNSSIYSKGRSHKYGIGLCSEGEIITMIIDFQNKTISFRKNGNLFADPFSIGILESPQYKKNMRFAVDMCEYGDEIRFLD